MVRTYLTNEPEIKCDWSCQTLHWDQGGPCRRIYRNYGCLKRRECLYKVGTYMECCWLDGFEGLLVDSLWEVPSAKLCPLCAFQCSESGQRFVPVTILVCKNNTVYSRGTNYTTHVSYHTVLLQPITREFDSYCGRVELLYFIVSKVSVKTSYQFETNLKENNL